MKLKTKLIAAQMPLIVALGLLSILSLGALERLGAMSQEILKDNYRSVLAMQRMKDAVERIDDTVALSLLGKGTATLGERAAPYVRTVGEELRLEEGNLTEAGEGDVVKRLRGRWEKSLRLIDSFRGAPDRKAAEELYFGELAPAFGEVRASAEEILAINQDAMVRKSDRARSVSRLLRGVALGGAAAATALGLLVSAVFTRRAVLAPLQVLQQAVRRAGEGDLEVRATIAGEDEIAQLALDFNTMAESLHRYRKSSLGDLLRAQQAAQASIDSLPNPIIIFGTKGNVLSLNHSAQEVLGAVDTVADLEPALQAEVERIREYVFSGRGAYAPRSLEDAVRLARAGGDRYLLVSANPLHEEDGSTTGATVALQDVTRFKRFDELKDNMVSTVAHEFRTPLTSMRMAIHLCLEEVVGPLTLKQADLLSAAREDCERLQSLVDDILDLSRLQSGKTSVNPIERTASSLLSQAVARHRAAAVACSVRLVAPTLGEEATVLADPERIAVVIDNLMTNALRYTPSGGTVELRARRGEGWVRFEVVDTGPGIPEAHHARLFDKLYQVPGADGGSSGLGLSIAREIILAHGGEIGVESEQGRGSTFWFTLPEPRGG